MAAARVLRCVLALKLAWRVHCLPCPQVCSSRDFSLTGLLKRVSASVSCAGMHHRCAGAAMQVLSMPGACHDSSSAPALTKAGSSASGGMRAGAKLVRAFFHCCSRCRSTFPVPARLQGATALQSISFRWADSILVSAEGSQMAGERWGGDSALHCCRPCCCKLHGCLISEVHVRCPAALRPAHHRKLSHRLLPAVLPAAVWLNGRPVQAGSTM